MRPRYQITRAILVSVFIGLSNISQALAQSEVAEHSHLYSGVEGGLFHLSLPDFQFGFMNVGNPLLPLLDFDPEVTGGVGAGFVGIVWEEARIGEDFRTELSGYYGAGSTEISRLDTGTTGFVTIDGQLVVAFQGFIADANAHVDLTHFGIDLLAKTDFRVGNNIWLTPFFGPSFMGLDQEYDVRMEWLGVVGPPQTTDVKEDLDARYYGATFGLEMVGQPAQNLTLTAGVGASFYYASADLDAKQVLSEINAPPGFPPFPTVRVSDDDLAFAYKARGRLGFEYDFGFGLVGIEGSADYISYVPHVVNPPVRDFGIPFDLPPPVRIDDDDAVVFKGMVRVTIPFN